MDKATFDRIVKSSVDAGADKAQAEDYVIKGFKIPVDDKGKPVFGVGDSALAKTKTQKPKAKAKAKP